MNNLLGFIKEKEDDILEVNKINNEQKEEYVNEELIGSEDERELDQGYDLVTEESDLSDNDEGEGTTKSRKITFSIELKEHKEHLLRYLKTLLDNPWVFELILTQLSGLLEQPTLSNNDQHLIFTIITFLNSLLRISLDSNKNSINPLEYYVKLLVIFKDNLILDLINGLAASIGENRFRRYSWLIVEFVNFLTKKVDFDHLLKSVGKEGMIDEVKVNLTN